MLLLLLPDVNTVYAVYGTIAVMQSLQSYLSRRCCMRAFYSSIAVFLFSSVILLVITLRR